MTTSSHSRRHPDQRFKTILLSVLSLLSDETTVELSGLLSKTSVMILVAPAVLPLPKNVSVVGESLIPIIVSDRIPTTVTLNSPKSLPCNVMPLVYETVKQNATGPSSTILVLIGIVREN